MVQISAPYTPTEATRTATQTDGQTTVRGLSQKFPA